MATRNTKSCLTRSKKFSFLTKTKSNSFPRARSEETSDPNASLKHSLSAPSSPSYTYTSVKDLIPSVRSNGRSPLSHGGFCSFRSPEDIAISNALVQKAAWLYLQPLPKIRTPPPPPRTYFWGLIRNRPKSPANTCLEFLSSNMVGKITHALDMVLAVFLWVVLAIILLASLICYGGSS
ncbi:hypothetical protein DKX38_006597 [Salix brachista]|uniref:Uncharacterized protein n=1 Tax=Salix brachista TaxID=2182728 RepID=A0A5N5N281_9ROSI|nr:hypothetical protein DKX38_006597 [Salix brachista]